MPNSGQMFFDSIEKDECVDINECESDCNRKGQDCINTIGSYICNCQPGFRLDDFGKSEITYAFNHLSRSRSPSVTRSSNIEFRSHVISRELFNVYTARWNTVLEHHLSFVRDVFVFMFTIVFLRIYVSNYFNDRYYVCYGYHTV